jgi:hypothetical protein
MSYVTGVVEVQKNIAALYAGTRKNLVNGMREVCSLLEGYAKNNHPWTARTGNTDNSTDARIVSATIDEITAALTAGMDYDVFLELARSGRWAWLMPAIMANQDKIIEILVRHGAIGAASSTKSLASVGALSTDLGEV